MIITSKVSTDNENTHRPLKVDYYNHKKLLTGEAIFEYEITEEETLLCSLEYHSKKEDAYLSFENRSCTDGGKNRYIAFGNDSIKISADEENYYCYASCFENYTVFPVFYEETQIAMFIRNNVRNLIKIYIPDEYMQDKDIVLLFVAVFEYGMYTDFLGMGNSDENPYNKLTDEKSRNYSRLDKRWLQRYYADDETCNMICEWISSPYKGATGTAGLWVLFMLSLILTVLTAFLGNAYVCAAVLVFVIITFARFTRYIKVNLL